MRSSAIASRSAEPSPRMCRWPRNSLSVRGRSLSASGATAGARSRAASEKRSPMSRSMLPGLVTGTQTASELWGSADYDRLARRFADVHDEVVRRLEPGPGVRWLDVATGTGGVAIRAARGGADVVGMDIAPRLLEQGRTTADGLPIRFDEGDAERLPYSDASFDVVSSVFGAIFADDHAAVAR